MARSVPTSAGVLLVCALWVSGARSAVQDHCDTTIWDASGQAVGVRQVSAHCAEGRISWRSPYGALRISLQPHLYRSESRNATFEACFLASAGGTAVKVSLDDSTTGLHPVIVLSPGSPPMSRERCFRSVGAPVMLYAESDPVGESAALGQAEIEYDIRYLPERGERQDDDCRPCTDEEILEAACSSDTVFAGTIDHVTHNPDHDETTLHLKVTKMIRQRTNIYRGGAKVGYPRLKFHTLRGVEEWPANEAAASLWEDESGQSEGRMTAPYRCGIRKGLGEFLFTGRARFRRAFLRCAPRMEEFIRLWKRAKVKGRNVCALD